MVERICKNCRFFVHSDIGIHIGQDWYECHRRAPSTRQVKWPQVDEHEFCGEFKAKGTAHV